MIWKCEVRNSYTSENVWAETEVIGDNFLVEFRRRFGKLDFRNVRQYDYVSDEWVKIDVEKEA